AFHTTEQISANIPSTTNNLSSEATAVANANPISNDPYVSVVSTGASTLRILLSFAVGGLLGDVFLHLLPEAWQNDLNNTKPGEHVSLKSGLWCLTGMLVFIVVEKLFAATENEEEESKEQETIKQNGSAKIKEIEIEEIEKLLRVERRQRGKSIGEGICDSNGIVSAKELYDTCVFNNNTKGVCCNSVVNQNGSVRCNNKGNRWMGRCLLREAREQALKATKEKSNKKDVIHEIPHEVGDFAILLKSGFSRWEAAKAQLATAAAGLIGAMTAVIFSGARNSIEAKTSWIVPFTAGGFLHIALVTVLPDLLREPDKIQSLKHLGALVSGIVIMAFMTYYFG
ncbi:hypothetical protein SFRURICE_003143, partial [Spodoptera frugiperda]